MQWKYVIVASTGGSVQTPNGSMRIVQVLNSAGQQGGELVTVIPAGSSAFEWVIKFPFDAATDGLKPSPATPET